MHVIVQLAAFHIKHVNENLDITEDVVFLWCKILFHERLLATAIPQIQNYNKFFMEINKFGVSESFSKKPGRWKEIYLNCRETSRANAQHRLKQINSISWINEGMSNTNKNYSMFQYTYLLHRDVVYPSQYNWQK